MRNKIFTKFLILLMGLFLFASINPAQNRSEIKLPDLIVKDIKLVNDCKIAVTVANIGNAGVPADKYVLPKAVGIQMYNGSKPWGGLILKGFDPAGKLKKPGGVATYIWFPGAANLNLKPGWNTLKVIADNNKNLTELKEYNNTLTKRVYCKKTAENKLTE
jgi:hypothetical protein